MKNSCQNSRRNLNRSQKYGLPIRKGFWDSKDDGGYGQAVARAPLRAMLDPSLPAVLCVGGGDVMGGIVEIAKALGNELGRTLQPTAQMVIVCGKNEQAHKELERWTWGPGVNVIVQGFVNNMDQWMRASDVLVTKAGPGTIAEASICGLPCMLFAYLPGQEEGNIPFVERTGFGKYSGVPTEIASTVKDLLRSPATLESMRHAALAAARPQATLDIAKDLADMAFLRRREKRQRPRQSMPQIKMSKPEGVVTTSL